MSPCGCDPPPCGHIACRADAGPRFQSGETVRPSPTSFCICKKVNVFCRDMKQKSLPTPKAAPAAATRTLPRASWIDPAQKTAPGTRLAEVALAERLPGVATPVRAALKLLASRRLVGTHEPRLCRRDTAPPAKPATAVPAETDRLFFAIAATADSGRLRRRLRARFYAALRPTRPVVQRSHQACRGRGVQRKPAMLAVPADHRR